MAYNFDPNKYKGTFNNMFGSGSFDRGLSSAREIGRSKAQAEFEKDEYKRRMSEAKKAYDKAKKDAEKAEKEEQKRRQEEAKLAARNEASKRAPDLTQKQYYNKMNKVYSYGNQIRMEEDREKRTIRYGDEPKKKKKEAKKKDDGFLDDVGDFFGGAWKGTKDVAKDAGEGVKNRAKVVSSFLPGGKTPEEALKEVRKDKKSKATKEVQRFALRTQNAAALGGYGLADKLMDGKDQSDLYKARKGSKADMASDILGSILPGSLAFRGAKGAGALAKKTTPGAKLAEMLAGDTLKKKTARVALEGAGTGAIFGTSQAAMTEMADPDKRTAMDHAKMIGLETAGGAVLDPLITLGGGKLLSKLKKPKQEEKAAELLGLPEPKLGLPEPKTSSRLKYNEPETSNSEEILGLPAPKTQRVISAKKTSDVYARKLSRLFEEANKSNMPPGREREFVEDLWSRMAEPNDPDLDTLIDLATPSIKRMNMNPAEMVSKARGEFNNPYGFDKYSRFKANEEIAPTPNEGAPLSFKRERFNPVINENVSYVGKNTNPSIQKVLGDLNIKPKRDGINVSSTPNSRIEKLMKKTGEETVDAVTKEQLEDLIPSSKKKTSSKELYENISPQRDPGIVRASDNPPTQKLEEIAVKVQNGEKLHPTEWEALLSNSGAWKDANPFFYARDTIGRNFDKTMGEDAPLFKKLFVDPLKKKEADRIRFKNDVYEGVKQFKIKPGSKDDKLVQKYGEGKITLDELKAQTKNWATVEKAAEHFRGIYDNTLNMINKELEKFGYDPIPKRENYFPHYTSDKSILKDMFGVDTEVKKLPVDINGITDDFLPKKNFFAHALKRKGDETSYGASEGLDRYLEGASRLIAHTENLHRLRGLDGAIRQRHGVTNAGREHLSNFAGNLTEFTNKLAGKQSRMDRGIESVFGRNALNLYKGLQRNTGANMTGANISSALTGFIPATQAAAQTKKKSFFQGALETIRSVVNDDGFAAESDFLTKRMGSDPLYRTKFDTVRDKSFWLMKVIDGFNAQTIVRGKYNELIEKGLPHPQALKQADDFAESIMAGRSLESMPTLFQNKTLGPITQFQLEVNNQLTHLFRDIPKNLKGQKTAITLAYAQVALYGWLYNNMYEQLTGRRSAIDPINLANELYEKSKEQDYAGAVSKAVETTLGQLPLTSFFVEGRVPISAAWPDVRGIIDGKKSIKEEAANIAPVLLPPAGGMQAKKAYQGIDIFNTNKDVKGVYGEREGKEVLRYPVEDSLANNIRGVLFGKSALPETRRYYDENLRDLGTKQTEEVLSSNNPMGAYNDIITDRKLKNLRKEVTKVEESDLSQKEKDKKIEKLLKMLENVKSQ